MNVFGPGPVTIYEWLIAPAVRDAWLYIPCIIFWFACHYILSPLVGNILLGKKYTKLSDKDRADWDIRFVSSLNGVLCLRAVYIFATENVIPNETCNLYAELPGLEFSRILIVSYFLWDLIVCVIYGWGAAFTIHAVAAGLGCYMLAYPFSDAYAPYFTGTFEISNIFLHVSSMLALTKSMPGVAQICQYIFAFLFLVVRVIGGTYFWYSWGYCAFHLLQSGLQHSVVSVLVCGTNLTVIQLLQFFWLKRLVRVALGHESM